MKWKDRVIEGFLTQLAERSEWSPIYQNVLDRNGIGVHMAVFNEPFLSAMFDNEKQIESRFSRNRITPYRRVYEGDAILIKRNGGNIEGFFIAGKIEYWTAMRGDSFETLEGLYGMKIASHLDSSFWEHRKGSRFGTLIEVSAIYRLQKFSITKKDRITWSVLKDGHSPQIFNDPRFHD